MPTTRLTEKAIARLPAPDPSGKQMLHWDSELKGFGVLCSGTSGAKSYVVQHSLKDGRRRRVTLAPVNIMKLDVAIVEAKKVLGQFYSGRDPKTLSRNNPTLKSALSDFLEARTDLRPKSVHDYKDKLNRYLADWMDLPLKSISREMVEERLRRIAKDVAAKGRYTGNAAANATMRCLRAVYNYASDRAPADNPMPANPVKLKKIWLPVRPRTRSVVADDLAKFYDAVCALESKVASDYLRLLLFTGLRRTEAASLRWSYIDFDRRVIALPGTITKGKRDFNLPMGDFVHAMLLARRAAAGDTGWIFPATPRAVTSRK